MSEMREMCFFFHPMTVEKQCRFSVCLCVCVCVCVRERLIKRGLFLTPLPSLVTKSVPMARVGAGWGTKTQD